MFCCCDEAPTSDELAFDRQHNLSSTVATSAVLEFSKDTSADAQPVKEPAALSNAEVFALVKVTKAEVARGGEVFTATLAKSSGPGFGWHLDALHPDHIFICRLAPASELRTPIEVYNASAPPGRQIQAGDYVFEVNGMSGSSEQLCDAVRNLDKVTLKIARPVLFNVSVDKMGKTLGLELRFGPSGSALLINGKTSEEAHPEVRTGDRIIGVNGTYGKDKSCKELMSCIRAESKLDLCISRPPEP